VALMFVLGDEAVCSDGYRGRVQAVVLDPATGTVTHLVVEPDGRSGLARLVPMDLVDTAADVVRLRCTELDFQDLEAAEETLAEFTLDYEVPVQLLPAGWRGTGGPVTQGGAIPRIPEKETVDVVPPGEVEERSGGRVHATDGDIGQVRALRVDPASRQVTHVLVREGHLLARKDVAVPFSTVTGFDDGVRLSLTRQQVRDLPPADTGPAAP
jgi:sporulation protein YlmC with PRC-barrel domain